MDLPDMDKPLELLVNDIHKPAEVRTIAHSSYQNQMEKYITHILKPGQWMKAPYYKNDNEDYDEPRVDDADGSLENLTEILQADPFYMGIEIADSLNNAIYLMDDNDSLHVIPFSIYTDPDIDNGRNWADEVTGIVVHSNFTDDAERILEDYGFRFYRYDPEGSDWEDGAAIYELTGLPEVNAPQEPEMNLPYDYGVAAFPNPFNSQVNLKYHIPKNGNVFLRVYDSNGKLVEKLYGGFQSAGEHTAVWNTEGVPSGQYLIHMNAGKHKETKPVQLIR